MKCTRTDPWVCRPVFFSPATSITCLTWATGRRWWRATPTSLSTTTSGTTWWSPGTTAMCTSSRSTRAPWHSTLAEPVTLTLKVPQIKAVAMESTLGGGQNLLPPVSVILVVIKWQFLRLVMNMISFFMIISDSVRACRSVAHLYLIYILSQYFGGDILTRFE